MPNWPCSRNRSWNWTAPCASCTTRSRQTQRSERLPLSFRHLLRPKKRRTVQGRSVACVVLLLRLLGERSGGQCNHLLEDIGFRCRVQPVAQVEGGEQMRSGGEPGGEGRGAGGERCFRQYAPTLLQLNLAGGHDARGAGDLRGEDNRLSQGRGIGSRGQSGFYEIGRASCRER